jgi:predicted lipopolysaccharide heptosyltransferase III
LSPREPQKIDLSSIEKILLVRLRRIGDVVMTTPAVRALKERFPHAHITYLVEEPCRDLVEGNPDLDEVLVYPRRLSVWAFLKRMRSLRSQKYDLLIDFHGGPRAFWITLFSSARYKVGHRLKFKHLFYTLTIPRESGSGLTHSVENHFSLVRAAGVKTDTIPRLILPPSRKGEKARVEKLLREKDLSEKLYFVLHIGAGNQFRDWGPENLKGLLQGLCQRTDSAVVLIGGPEDKPRALALEKIQPDRIFSLAGQLNLREVRDLVEGAVLYIGPDSGPMHIAASTQTPIVAFFGPTLPAHFAPWKARARLLEKDSPCRPCRQRKCRLQDIPCLLTITPEEVIEAMLSLLPPTS